MIEIQSQLRDSCPICKSNFGTFLLPFGDEAKEKIKDFKPNQLVTDRITGTRKERSIRQLGTYWACCTLVAENSDNPQWNTKEKVDFGCRVSIHFVDPNLRAVRSDGTIVEHYMSISFANLKHMEACRYFDRAFDVMAQAMGCSVEELIKEAQSQMQSY